MNTIDHSYLSDQLNTYISDLINIQKHISKNHRTHHHLSQLQQKINIKIQHFQIAIHEINNKQYHQSTINQMHVYFQNVFTQVVKEAHRLLQIKVGPEGKQKLEEKMHLLREIEGEMTQVWEDKQVKQQKGMFISLNANLSMLSAKFNHLQLKNIAKEYLHKQFLAIRMIAYKLYQNYINHSHKGYKQRFNLIRKQQQQLQIQTGQLVDVNKQLKNEQKRMIRQLNELKMINNMISKRYFVQNQKSSPGNDDGNDSNL